MIAIQDLTFAYAEQVPVFDGFTWRVRGGEIWSVLGPSGCGKSTLLMLLAGLLHSQSGEVVVGGERVALVDEGDVEGGVGEDRGHFLGRP